MWLVTKNFTCWFLFNIFRVWAPLLREVLKLSYNCVEVLIEWSWASVRVKDVVFLQGQDNSSTMPLSVQGLNVNLSGKRNEIFKRKPGRDEYSTQRLREKLGKVFTWATWRIHPPLLPVEWDASPSPRFIRLTGQFTSIYLYSWLERSAVRVKRIAPRKQHNNLVRPRLQRSFNHWAAMSPTLQEKGRGEGEGEEVGSNTRATIITRAVILIDLFLRLYL